MKKVLKICANEWKNASHDKRELSAVKELGAEVQVMAKGDKTGIIDDVDGFNVYRVSTRPLGRNIPTSINRVISIFTWAHEARKQKADIISGHDIIGLFIGHLSNFLNPNKALLVYDSHEFEAGQTNARSLLTTWGITKLEKYLMKRSRFTIMVNETIMNEVKRNYRFSGEVTYARNIPVYWDIQENEILKKRSEIIRANNWKENDFIIMYHGALFKNRGIESIIKLLSINENINAIILGDAHEEAYLEMLKHMSQKFNVNDRIYFHKAVALHELYKYVGAADVGMVILENVCKNHYYALPNKLFENIQSLTPVIGSRFPEIKKIINEYGIGLTTDPSNLEEMNLCVEKMRLDRDFYNQCKRNLIMAKKELCWENEKEKIKEVYKKIL